MDGRRGAKRSLTDCRKCKFTACSFDRPTHHPPYWRCTRADVLNTRHRGSSRSGGAPSQFTSTLINEFLEKRILQTHIKEVLIPGLSERYYWMRNAIDQDLIPRGVTTVASSSPIAGGYFIWITLPTPLRAADIVQRAQEEEALRLAPGDLFQVAGDADASSGRFHNSIRLCFAWEEPANGQEGVRRLARLLDRAKSDPV